MKPIRRRWRWFLGGLVGTFVLVLAAALLATRTEPGRERILAITLRALGGQLHPNAELVVERLEGGLFTGARMYGIRLRDPAGRQMVVADSAYIEYRVASFFGGDVVIDDLVVYSPQVLLYRLPGDTVWNYQALLQDTVPAEPPRPGGRATVLRRVQVVDGNVTIQMAWEPDEDLSEQERAQEIEAALADTSRLAVEEVEGGYLRTMLMQAPDAVVEDLTIAPDDRGGTYLRVVRAAAVVGLYRDEPLRVEGVQGELSLREGVLRYTAAEVRLPDSQLTTEGVLDMTGEEPLYDIRLNGTAVALRDLQWLYPAFPDEGRARFGMDLETRPEELFLRATDLEFEARGTRLVGDFSLLMGDSLLFSDVSLRAEPLDIGTVQRMLPVSIPVRGLQIGSVAVESSTS